LILYPTCLMSNAVAHLYARIIKFMIQATKWYKQGKLVHTFSKISKPWTLNFKDNVDDIAAQSRYIDELSGIASKAELRDSHLELLETRAEVREVRIEIRSLADLVNARANHLLQTSLCRFIIYIKFSTNFM
jgi:nitrate reductase beta subunit